jgi:hypothetical protein
MQTRDIVFEHVPVFGLMDAASNAEIFHRLVNSGQEYQSLYEGEQGAQLAAYGPILITLAEDNAFTRYLLDQGWGKAWCTYLRCSQSLAELRHHLRRFLTVRTASGQMIYFRFYDPRILRQFLPTCSREQANDFFGPITEYFVEGASPLSMIRFSQVDGQVKREEVEVQ